MNVECDSKCGAITRRSFFGKAVSAAAFASLAGCLPRRTGGGAATSGKPLLKVGVISDVHILVAGDSRWQSCEVFEKALRLYDSMRADAVLLCGDIAYCGLVAELECAASIWKKVFPEGRRSDGEPIVQLFELGDHDLGGFAHKYQWALKNSADPDAVNHPLVDADIPAVWERLFGEKWTPIQLKTVKGYNFVVAHFPVNGGGGTGGRDFGLLDAQPRSRARFGGESGHSASHHRPRCGGACLSLRHADGWTRGQGCGTTCRDDGGCGLLG